MEENVKQESVLNQTPVDLYVLVPSNKGDKFRFTLLSIKNMHQFEGVAPTKEILEAHFAAERVRMEIGKRDHPDMKYIPQPLYIDTTKEVFEELVKACRSKQVSFKPESSHIALSLGTQFPCCIIGIRDDESNTNNEE